MSEREADRRAIARELHDGPIQHLTAASLRLHSALGSGALSADLVAKVSADVDEAAQELRALMGRLMERPSA